VIVVTPTFFNACVGYEWQINIVVAAGAVPIGHDIPPAQFVLNAL